MASSDDPKKPQPNRQADTGNLEGLGMEELLNLYDM